MLTTKNPNPVTVSLGDVNTFQIVRVTIECPIEAQVGVVLDVQGALVDQNGETSSVVPLPSVVVDPDTAAKLYVLIRDLIYASFQSSSPVVPSDAVLSPFVVPMPTPAPDPLPDNPAPAQGAS